MKRTGIGIWLLAAVVLISGCGKRADNGKGIDSGETVDKVIESQVKKEEQKKKVLHNTKLLMKNYNSLKLHADKAIYSVNDVEDLQEYDDQDKAYILSTRSLKNGATSSTKL